MQHTSTVLRPLAKKFQAAGIKVLGPWPGSRVRPDGQVLSWKSLSLADDHNGLLPFFIEWRKDAVHPSADAPGGCQIERFALAQANTAELLQALRRIDVEAPVEHGLTAQLHLRIMGPKGALEVRS
jgi:hypothetical protein